MNCPYCNQKLELSDILTPEEMENTPPEIKRHIEGILDWVFKETAKKVRKAYESVEVA